MFLLISEIHFEVQLRSVLNFYSKKINEFNRLLLDILVRYFYSCYIMRKNDKNLL